MSPSLEDCPNEVIETIVVLLDLDDTRNLRQSCRSLAAKTTQSHFKSYYHIKRVDVTPQALKAFVDVTQAGRLGCLVQELTLVGLTSSAEAADDAPESGSVETGLGLLIKAFSGIASNSKTGNHLSLSLEIAVIQNDNGERVLPSTVTRGGWRPVWKSAAQTFHMTLRALAVSKLPLEKLDVYNGSQSQACSLACDELGCLDFQDEGLARSLSSLKTFSISLSDRIIEAAPIDFAAPPKEEDIREAKKKFTAESNFVGLVRLLELVSSLDSLEIHYYSLNTARHLIRDSYAYHELLFKQVAKSEKLPRLKQCTLRGVHISGESLLAFIQRTTPHRLVLECITLSKGTFSTAFDYCTQDIADMEELCFDYLLEEKTHVLYFRSLDLVDPAQTPQPAGPARDGKTSLRRVGAEVRQPIVYHYRQGRTISTPQTNQLRLQRRKEYGPP